MTTAPKEDGIMLSTALIRTVVGALVAAIVFMFGLVVSGKDRTILDQEDRIRGYEEVAREALSSAREMADYHLRKEGKMPLGPLIAPVVPESHSPPTKQQEHVAKLATLRAEMALLKLAVGQEPRTTDDSKEEADTTLP